MTDVAYVYGLVDPRYSCVRYAGRHLKHHAHSGYVDLMSDA